MEEKKKGAAASKRKGSRKKRQNPVKLGKIRSAPHHRPVPAPLWGRLRAAWSSICFIDHHPSMVYPADFPQNGGHLAKSALLRLFQ